MKLRLKIILGTLVFVLPLSCNKNSSGVNNGYIIEKGNGQIILAYKAFEDFLSSDRSWESYKTIVLDAYPQVQVVHDKQVGWGAIDPEKFPEDIKTLEKEDFQHLFSQYSEDELHFLYDSVVGMAHTILEPLTKKQVDLCFFLPYGSCFVAPEKDKNTIYISMWINPADVQKIMVHEYGHILHFSRRPEEPLTLARELISEGMAVYLTTQIIDDIEISNSVPFMPQESFEWCMENEQLIKDSIMLDLNDTTFQIFTKYISDGSFATPPEGFVEKTAYFAGYRIIEKCVEQGMPIEDICSLDSEAVIRKSNYFLMDSSMAQAPA